MSCPSHSMQSRPCCCGLATPHVCGISAVFLLGISEPTHARDPARRALLLRRFLDSAGQQPDAWEHIALVLTNATRRYRLALRMLT